MEGDDATVTVGLAAGRPADPVAQRLALGRLKGRLFGDSGPITVSRYLLREPLRAGGMGVVYTAYDPELRREVAIKLLSPGRRGEVGAHAQLLREAQAMARLAHPNIVTVHDVGTYLAAELDPEAPPGSGVFVVMELIDGEPLSTWQETRRRWPEIVAMYLGIARGVAHAHAAGIVHRDLKPANVLVDRDGRPRVLDFGIARLQDTDRDELSGSGTPRYMAPEQHRGAEVDHRADQFALCVALFEALTTRPPFSGQDLDDLLARKLRGVDASTPQLRAVPSWLTRACLRGLRPDPADRFASMDDLIAALERGLARRRRLRWGAATLGAVAITAGAVHLSADDACAQGHRRLDAAWNEQTRARLQRSFAATALPHAAPTWDATRAELDAYAKQWRALHERSCTREGWTADADASLANLRQACASARLDDFEALTAAFADADAALLDAALTAVQGLPRLDTCEHDGALQAAFGRPQPAEAVPLRARLAEGKALRFAGKLDRSRALAQEVEAADIDDGGALRAEALLLLGQLATTSTDDAATYLFDAITTARAAGRTDVEIEAMLNLAAKTAHDRADPDEAARWVGLARASLSLLPSDALRAKVENTAATVALARDDPDAALAHANAALAAARTAFGPDDLRVANAYRGIGRAEVERGNWAAARDALTRCLDLERAVLGPEHPALTTVIDDLGRLAGRQGDWSGALAEYERALAIDEATIGPDHPHAAIVLNNMAGPLQQLGRTDDAAAALERALAINTAVYGPQHPGVAANHGNLAVVLAAAGRSDEAREHVDRAVDIAVSAWGEAHTNVAQAHASAGEVYTDIGQPEDAIAHYQTAIAILSDRLEPDHPLLAPWLLAVARLHAVQGRRDDAVAALETADRIARAREVAPIDRALVRLALARLYADSDLEGARRLAAEALADAKQADASHQSLRDEVTALIEELESAP